MKVEGEGIHDGPMALQTVSSDHGFLNRRLNRLRLNKRSSGPEKGVEKTRKGGDYQ